MARTFRKILTFKEPEEGKHILIADETKAKWYKIWHRRSKLEPYIKDRSFSGKFKPYSYNFRYRNNGFNTKANIKNANRSRKKALRQIHKIQIQKEIQHSALS